MPSEKTGSIRSQTKQSIFRRMDRFELLSGYVLCFCFNSMFDYSKSVNIDSYLLSNFLRQLYEYQILIVLLLSLTVVFFHFQMIRRKKVEIHCRIVVGDTIGSVVFRYFIDCLIILCIAFGISGILNAIAEINITNNRYLLYVFIGYILISSGRVRKYENI